MSMIFDIFVVNFTVMICSEFCLVKIIKRNEMLLDDGGCGSLETVRRPGNASNTIVRIR